MDGKTMRTASKISDLKCRPRQSLRQAIPALIFAVLCILSIAAPLQAHEIRPAVVTVDLATPTSYAIVITANIEALLVGIGAEHKDSNDAPQAVQYNQLRATSTEELRAKFDQFAPQYLRDIGIAFDGQQTLPTIVSVMTPTGVDPALARISTIRLTGTIPPDAKTFRWAYPTAFGSSVLRVKRGGSTELETSWLKDGAASADIPLTAGTPRRQLFVFLDYVALGFTHIVPGGIDHILFVLGLFLLSTQMRPLLVQVTAFTVAHSITLALGLYGVVEVSPNIVEPLIALSIVFVAVENLMTSQLSFWRPFVVFAFGLLHGLGFAGVLLELGLPRDQFVLGLVAFNIGVEFGQLSVIAVAWLTTAYWFRREPWYRARVVWPASAAIALVGLFWTVQRIWFV
jgi:HupE / UreJ protein